MLFSSSFYKISPSVYDIEKLDCELHRGQEQSDRSLPVSVPIH